jgi:hypothetical protein
MIFLWKAELNQILLAPEIDSLNSWREITEHRKLVHEIQAPMVPKIFLSLMATSPRSTITLTADE